MNTNTLEFQPPNIGKESDLLIQTNQPKSFPLKRIKYSQIFPNTREIYDEIQ